MKRKCSHVCLELKQKMSRGRIRFLVTKVCRRWVTNFRHVECPEVGSDFSIEGVQKKRDENLNKKVSRGRMVILETKVSRCLNVIFRNKKCPEVGLEFSNGGVQMSDCNLNEKVSRGWIDIFERSFAVASPRDGRLVLGTRPVPGRLPTVPQNDPNQSPGSRGPKPLRFM